jgi:hypothetical protein
MSKKTGTQREQLLRRRVFRFRSNFLIGLLLLLATGQAGATGQIGEPAADFTLQDSEGNWHTLSDYRDHVVVLFMVGYA